MTDLHVHCDYSVDAEGSADEYARAALDEGLTHICFTTHCDLEPERRHHDGRVRLRGEIVEVTADWVGSYVDDIRQVGRAYSDKGLEVLCGLEIGYVPGIEQMIEAVISSNRFDFILGGVHTLAGLDFVSTREADECFRAYTPRQMCEKYFAYLEEAIESGLFDCIAHIDIYKRCGLDFYGESLNVAHRGLIDRSLDGIARRGLSLEINSGGLRKGLEWPYPSPDILRAARDAGVSYVTTGSDCHRPDQVGYGLETCFNLAVEAGFDRVDVFQNRNREEIPIEELNAENR
jgi:histidinol-phosphatase (PHP family)